MLANFIKRQINKVGFDLVKIDKEKWPSDFEDRHLHIIKKVQPYTMTTPERIFGLIEAVNYISKYNVPGDIVECGVWKGGSMLAIADVLCQQGDITRRLYLYDTFEGMPAPTDEDKSFTDEKAEKLLDKDKNKEKNLIWAYSSLDSVKRTMALSAYNHEKINYVQGKVEVTIPGVIPDRIALLRLDTDWYESTRHELIHLFPRVVKGGVLIIDDYGYWKGAKKAVDEYFASNNIPILLNRLDDTGRIAIKL